MRIIAGKYKGHSLKTPKSDAIRPTSDRLRETLFNILASSYGGLEGKRVLDICAGTGAFGLEALSRGAAYCAFVDNGIEARGLLRENTLALGVTSNAQILKRDACKMGESKPFEPFDLIFADPPYNKGLGELIFTALIEGGWAKQDALFILEEAKSASFIPPSPLSLIEMRDYGDTRVYFLEFKA